MKNTGLLIALLLSLSGCWPTSVSFRDSSMPETWKQFYVTPLELNAATAPANYNANLTESLRSGIQNNTKLKMAQNIEAAQVKISGIVTGYNTTPLALKAGDVASQNRLTITVNFTIITPTKGLEEMTLTSTRFADYDSGKNLTDVESQLIQVINQLVVQDVINKLLSNW